MKWEETRWGRTCKKNIPGQTRISDDVVHGLCLQPLGHQGALLPKQLFSLHCTPCGLGTTGLAGFLNGMNSKCLSLENAAKKKMKECQQTVDSFLKSWLLVMLQYSLNNRRVSTSSTLLVTFSVLPCRGTTLTPISLLQPSAVRLHYSASDDCWWSILWLRAEWKKSFTVCCLLDRKPVGQCDTKHSWALWKK